MAALLENKVKELLARHGIQVPRGTVIADRDEVSRAATIRFPAVAKALIPIGKKGKAGAVRMVADAGELSAACNAIIGSRFRGFTADAVLVEDREEIEDELFLSFNFDGLLRSAVVVLGRLGGVDVEEAAAVHSDAFDKIALDLTRESVTDDLAQRWQGLGLTAAKAEAAARATEQAFAAFRTYDARVLEINPLAIRPDGACVAVGTLMDIDDEALFRQPELAGWVEYGSSRLGRQPTPLERKLLDLNARSKSGSLRFMEFPGGDLGCLLSGGGCSLWSTDHVIDQGGSPATYYDATTPSEDMLRALFEGVLAIPGLRGLVFGSNIINLARIESRVAILIDTLEKMEIDLERFPVVLRMAGPGEAEARRTAARLPHVQYYGDEVTLDYALDRFVERVNAAKAKYPGPA
jgi:succinyl-CoA synthetase beta subunit